LRIAANAIGNLKKSNLTGICRRIAYRKGRQADVSATARKLATITWTMITKRVSYKQGNEYLFQDQRGKLKLVTRIQ
jgi:hypothetical protein